MTGFGRPVKPTMAWIRPEFDGSLRDRRRREARKLVKELSPKPDPIDRAIDAYRHEPSHATLMRLGLTIEGPRQELFRRCNIAPGGTAMLVEMRHQLLKTLPEHPERAGIDADLVHLFRSWFNRGFLILQRIDWRASALVLERLIRAMAKWPSPVVDRDANDSGQRRKQPRMKKRKYLAGSLQRNQVVDLVAVIRNFNKYPLGQKATRVNTVVDAARPSPPTMRNETWPASVTVSQATRNTVHGPSQGPDTVPMNVLSWVLTP